MGLNKTVTLGVGQKVLSLNRRPLNLSPPMGLGWSMDLPL